jgi:hypothetical protein
LSLPARTPSFADKRLLTSAAWSLSLRTDEKPNGDRFVAVAKTDMAVWGAVAKIPDKPGWRALSRQGMPAGLGKRCIPHGCHQMCLAIAAGLGLGGNENYPNVFQPYGAFPDGTWFVDGIIS